MAPSLAFSERRAHSEKTCPLLAPVDSTPTGSEIDVQGTGGTSMQSRRPSCEARYKYSDSIQWKFCDVTDKLVPCQSHKMSNAFTLLHPT